jgi:hypothetical protein
VKLSDVRAQVAENWSDPEWWRYVAWPYAVRNAVLQPYYRRFKRPDGVDIMAEDWENLIVLDACRYDMFEELYDGPGSLERRYSCGANTPEFLRRNFAGETFHDTVYVTANPQVDVHVADRFHDLVSVWRTDWDEELNTVHPAAMAEATMRAHEAYPNKRIIAHFVQPHYPFVGPYGREAFESQAGLELSKRMANDEVAKSDHENVWLRLQKGDLDAETLRRAYWENLEVTLPCVHDLLEEFTEPTVVTSDHGNSFGTRAGPFPVTVYGHPEGVYTDDIVTIPWLAVEGTSNKRIVAEAPTETADAGSEEATERLKDLGYLG